MKTGRGDEHPARKTRAQLAVLISGNGSNLQSFIDACAADELDADIAIVLSNRPDAFGLERARQANIPAAVIDHRDYPSREAFDQAMLDALAPFEIDLVILAGFMRILTPVFINAYRGRLLNIHPSLLPKYPGLNTHQRAIEADEFAAGATVHFVTNELDGGPPVIQAQESIRKGVNKDDAKSLAARVLKREHLIYPMAVKWFVEGRLKLGPKHAMLDGESLGKKGFSAWLFCGKD